MKTSRRRRAWRPLLVAVLLICCDAAAARGVSVPPMKTLLEGNPDLTKVSSRLLQARWLAREELSLEDLAPEGALRPEPLPTTDGRPRVDVHLEVLTPALLAQLESAGLELTSHSFRWARASGLLALESLDEIAAIPAVRSIHPHFPPMTLTGSVTGQGDATHNADDARTQFGVDGTGITVGLMSDSFNDTLGGTESGVGCDRTVTGMDNQDSDDLPDPAGLLVDFSPGSDEGAALGEIVFDLAPATDLIFRTAFISEADFADGIGDLVDCGADIIVDDVIYFAEPMFQDGPVAQAAQEAVDAGVPFFSAAGNFATFGIDDPYSDSNPGTDDLSEPPSGDDFHDFVPGSGSGPVELAGADPFAAVTIPEDCTILFFLQWSDPWDGVLGDGAANDLDLFLCTAEDAGSCTISTSTTRTGCGAGGGSSGDPIEAVGAVATGGPGTAFLAVEHHCGTEDLRFRIFAVSPDCSMSSFDFEDGITAAAPGGAPSGTETPIYVDKQIFGHAAAEGVVAVAASFFREIDTGGTTDPPFDQVDVEPFSSLGGDIPFFFAGDGTPLEPLEAGAGGASPQGPPSPETRWKPEITCADGTNNTFFGADIDDFFEPPGDSDPNFFGTSASAPHAAGIASLVQDAAGNNLTPMALSEILKQSFSIDLEIPGVDPLSGYGLADALRSVASVNPGVSSPLVDDFFFDIGGGLFVKIDATGQVTLKAQDSITYGDGDYSNVDAFADTHIFTDGFESGDTSAWSNTVP